MIGIKGMEMPENCMECPLFDGEYGDCNIIGKPKVDATEERAECCPLVEIVTCKDCRHCYPDEDGRGYHCERDSNVRFSVYGDFYCADAERKE